MRLKEKKRPRRRRKPSLYRGITFFLIRKSSLHLSNSLPRRLILRSPRPTPVSYQPRAKKHLDRTSKQTKKKHQCPRLEDNLFPLDILLSLCILKYVPRWPCMLDDVCVCVCVCVCFEGIFVSINGTEKLLAHLDCIGQVFLFLSFLSQTAIRLEGSLASPACGTGVSFLSFFLVLSCCKPSRAFSSDTWIQVRV